MGGWGRGEGGSRAGPRSLPSVINGKWKLVLDICCFFFFFIYRLLMFLVRINRYLSLNLPRFWFYFYLLGKADVSKKCSSWLS